MQLYCKMDYRLRVLFLSPTQTNTQDILGNDVIYLDFDFSNCLITKCFYMKQINFKQLVNFKVTEANGYGLDMTPRNL